MPSGPLAGLRVLDLTHVWAGPLATRILADLGADVLKVEAASSRGPRDFGTALPLGGWIGGRPGEEPWNRNALFAKLQRNKRSLCIDLKADAGRRCFLALVAGSDVVIENFSAGTLEGLGLGYEALRAARHDIVYVSMPGYGQSGPYRDRVAFGTTVEPESGIGALLGYGPEEPRNSALALPDPITGLNGTAALLTALQRRRATGEGACVELSLHEAATSFCGAYLVAHQLGSSARPCGNRHPEMSPHGIYPCAGDDQWIAIACRDDAEWRGLCSLVPKLDAELDRAARIDARSHIDAALRRHCRAHSKEALAEALQTAGVPAGPLNTTPDMSADLQVRARGFFVPLDEGTPMPGNPIQMAGLDSAEWTPCPPLGADNRAVLHEWLGWDDERIDGLERDGVLLDEPPA